MRNTGHAGNQNVYPGDEGTLGIHCFAKTNRHHLLQRSRIIDLLLLSLAVGSNCADVGSFLSVHCKRHKSLNSLPTLDQFFPSANSALHFVCQHGDIFADNAVNAYQATSGSLMNSLDAQVVSARSDRPWEDGHVPHDVHTFACESAPSTATCSLDGVPMHLSHGICMSESGAEHTGQCVDGQSSAACSAEAGFGQSGRDQQYLRGSVRAATPEQTPPVPPHSLGAEGGRGKPHSDSVQYWRGGSVGALPCPTEDSVCLGVGFPQFLACQAVTCILAATMGNRAVCVLTLPVLLRARMLQKVDLLPTLLVLL